MSEKHGNFITKYIFSTDHKMIGFQFFVTSLIMMMFGGLFALGVRWQLAFPWTPIPFFGEWLFPGEAGQTPPEFYNMLFTMHASVMIFLVIIPILAGAFGNFLIPLMIGADDMAFPRLNMLSYWLYWPAIACFTASLFFDGGPGAGWTVYPALSDLKSALPANGDAITLQLFGFTLLKDWIPSAITFWLLGLTFVGISSMLGSVNYLTTIINMRAPGMTLFRMPMTIWGMMITAILQAFSLPVLTAAGFMLVADRELGTTFFIPPGQIVNNMPATVGSGQILLWQHLFWFYSHPAVYIMLLPAMGMVSDMLSTMSRKPLFGYRPMVFSMMLISGLGFIVWGHHMFISGMNPFIAMAFAVSTIMIALPSAVKTFNWLGTIWGGKIQFNTVTLNCIAFISMFVVGGLSGIFMAIVPIDIYIHDTYFIVAHFHYVLFGATLFAVFAGIQYWFPKMFGKMMSEPLGQIHFVLTFIGMNGTFFPMHFLGMAGMPRRYADPYTLYPHLEHLLPMNALMTYSAIIMGFAQFILLYNILQSWAYGKPSGDNPWKANTLEWAAPSPPPHGNFETPPAVYRGAYEYSSPETPGRDYWMQNEPPQYSSQQQQSQTAEGNSA